jgi:hypothetical protein
MIKLGTKFCELVHFFTRQLGIYEMMTSSSCHSGNDVFESIGEEVCSLLGIDCLKVVPGFVIDKVDNFGGSKKFFEHYPSGSTVKLMEHLNQMIACNEENTFRMYQYDQKEQNFWHYGQNIAPVYQLEKVKAKIV